MTMVLLPAASGGELCLNPDTASWILPLDPGSSCQVLMANGTSYDIALGVRSIQEIFADRFIELMLAQPSMIKRPVLDVDGSLTVGFKPDLYARVFDKA